MKCWCSEINKAKKDIETCNYILNKLSQVGELDESVLMVHNSLRLRCFGAYSSEFLDEMVKDIEKRQVSMERRIALSVSSFKRKKANLNNTLSYMRQEDTNYHEEQRRLALLGDGC